MDIQYLNNTYNCRNNKQMKNNYKELKNMNKQQL